MASDIRTLHAEDVPKSELEQLAMQVDFLIDDHELDRNGPLVAALVYIVGTLRDGENIHIITVG